MRHISNTVQAHHVRTSAERVSDHLHFERATTHKHQDMLHDPAVFCLWQCVAACVLIRLLSHTSFLSSDGKGEAGKVATRGSPLSWR